MLDIKDFPNYLDYARGKRIQVAFILIVLDEFITNEKITLKIIDYSDMYVENDIIVANEGRFHQSFLNNIRQTGVYDYEVYKGIFENKEEALKAYYNFMKKIADNALKECERITAQINKEQPK